jgi:hypothetical protein
MDGQLVTLTRLQAMVCLREGQAAGRAGQPATTCPYSAAGDATERVRVAAWMHAYVRSRRALLTPVLTPPTTPA